MKEPSSIPVCATEATLLVAIGNPGRQDDGLGWAFAEAVAPVFRGEVVYRYQLQVEDAELISRFDRVLFVDACRESLPQGWDCQPCATRPHLDFSSHYLPPGTVLSLAQQLYERPPQAWVLRLAGSAWALAEGLSPAGQAHLRAAVTAWGG